MYLLIQLFELDESYFHFTLHSTYDIYLTTIFKLNIKSI